MSGRKNNLKVLDKTGERAYNTNERWGGCLHKIFFYQTQSGKQPVLDYLRELQSKSDKDSRIKAGKINDYIESLSQYGLELGQPYIKHLDGDIWELRPLRDRIFFVAWHEGSFVLLHQFMKKTQKTPPREIAQAKREYADMIERGVQYE